VLSSLSDVSSVVAIDRDASRREAMTSRFANAGHPDLSSALSSVDAVVVAVPPRLHLEVAAEAIEAGKHVLVEKPLATSSRDARTLIELAQKAGVVLMVGHTFEFTAALQELRTRIARGELGEVQYIDAAWLNLGLYQDDINVLWDLAPHGISICNYLLDTHPRRVGAWGSSHGNAGFMEDVAMLRLQYENPEVTAYIRVSWLDPAKVRRVTVVGTKKMAVFNDLAHAEPLRIYDRGVETDDTSDYSATTLTYRYGEIVSPHINASEPLNQEVQHFLDCINRQETPRTDGANGLAVVATLEAADKALTSRTLIDITRPAPPTSALDGYATYRVPEDIAG
jgi:predicted dehydrogenase